MNAFEGIFVLLIQLNAVIVLSILSTMLTGFVVTIGEGWGKIRGSNAFQSYWRLIGFFVLEGVLIWISIAVVEPYVSGLMMRNLFWLIAFDFEFFAAFTLWFSHAFDFDFHWIAFGLMQIPVGITIIIYFLLYR